jgi:hypothetical protein
MCMFLLITEPLIMSYSKNDDHLCCLDIAVSERILQFALLGLVDQGQHLKLINRDVYSQS